MNNKVKFLRGTSGEYAVAEKDSDTIYFTTDDGKLYIGDKEVSGSDITIDDTLSDTSENPVQNKIINAVLNEKASKDTMTGATSSSAGKSGLVPAPTIGENNKFLRGDGTWQTVSGGGGESHDWVESYISKQVFGNGAVEETVTASGTWVVPEGVYFIDVFLVGGGGSAAIGTNRYGSGTTYYWGSCGGGGYTAFRQGIPVSPGEKLTIAIGAGGAAATVSSSYNATYPDGNPGGATTIKRGSTVLATAAGGYGGKPLKKTTTGDAGDGFGGGGFGGNVGASPNTSVLDASSPPGYTAYEASRCYNPRNGKYYANGGNISGARSTGGYGDGGNSYTKETVTESSSTYTKVLATAGFSGACLIYY